MKRIDGHIVMLLCAFSLAIGVFIGCCMGLKELPIPVLSQQTIQSEVKDSMITRKVYNVNENYISLIDRGEKRKIFYVEDKELFTWLCNQKTFIRMRGTLYPINDEGHIMSDSFILKKEEK